MLIYGAQELGSRAEKQLDDGIRFLTLALELMTDPHAMYQAGSEAVRTIMNRSIFTKLYADGDTITGHELREPFNVLADACTTWQGYPHQTDTTPGLRAPNRATRPRSTLHAAIPTQRRSSAAPETGHGATEYLTVSPALALAGQGSNKTPMVEVLTVYSHSAQAADLLLCRTMAIANPVRAARPNAKRPWSLRERLDEREIAELITAYREGATAASLATAHGVSLKSVKRLLRTAGIRRTSPTRRAIKATPAAANP
ncbi:MAG: hypothetical protein ACRDRP_03010 [Pseudonocardiaceae bacterium]